MRLDQHLATNRPEYSRATWQKYIKMGVVSVNGKFDIPTKIDVNEDDQIIVSIPKVLDFSAETLPIIYEDEDVLVVNKPIGVLSHAKSTINEEFTVADFIKPKTSYQTETSRPGIIHRLDRDTSGVLLTVKNKKAAKIIQRQFEHRTVQKTYSAIVNGLPKESEALIDLPIGRNPSAPSTFRVDPSGKSAQTTYQVIKSNGALSLVELLPKTGRTHQLRVHMQYIGTPIQGDRIYGRESDRLYLHAHKLSLTLPDGIHHTFEAPIPAEFEAMIKND
ncbi:MAG: RluA family pseudouridine synthase [Candidatus Saccharimonadales bacterium]